MSDNIFKVIDKKQIIEAIEEAEIASSGEIQVHVDSKCKGDVLDRAAHMFANLDMHKTKLRNAVLFYVALESHKFAVLGDAGINSVVPENFWDEIKEEMAKLFKAEKPTEALVLGIKMAGKALAEHFPYQGEEDINELPNDVSFGK
jgi:uncharacterized membrane protein